MMRIGFVSSLLTAMALAGCDPWEGFGDGNDSLGSVDPVTFPAASLGTGGNRTQPGLGLFQETPAYADGERLGYFPYLYPAGTTPIPDFLRIRDNGAANPRVPTIGAYNFDAPTTGVSPLPDTYPCAAPAGYSYDEVRDEVHFDQQGSVFAALPRATYNMGEASTTTYVPVVAEWSASSQGQPCQKFKSRTQVESVFGPFAASKATGKFMAWIVIDPAAAVYKFDDNPAMEMQALQGATRGLDLQKWGWFNRYLLAYLDGGYIPTEEATVTEAGMMRQLVRMRTQRLYYPRSAVITTGAGGMMAMAPGQRGAGYDVLSAKRADADYSPVCEVFTYDAGMPLTPAQLPQSAEAIEAMFMPDTLQNPATNRYIFCLQVR